MRDKLTKSDVKKIEEEIEYRKLVVRKEAIEAVKEARAHGDLSIMRQKKIKIKTKAGFAIWKEC